MFKKTLMLVAVAILSGCGSSDDSNNEVITFESSAQSFSPVFSGYEASREAEDNEAFYQLEGTHQAFPDEYDANNKGWRLQGMNRSDDLFMSIIGYVDGFEPEMDYDIDISASILTNVGSDCYGIGGGGVNIKLGASGIKPENTISDEVESGIYRPNIDKGNQFESGVNALYVGNLSNGIDCNMPEQYALKTMSTPYKISVRTDEQGGFWLLAGSDSGFEGLSHYYINRLEVAIDDTTLTYDFSDESLGFEPFFSDYPPSRDAHDSEKALGLEGVHQRLLGDFSETQGWLLSGLNTSENLFLGLKGKMSGYQPDTILQARVKATLVTSTPKSCDIEGFTPGESVFVKLGVSVAEPKVTLEGTIDGNIVGVSVDKGKGEASGNTVQTVGNLANEATCEDKQAWESKRYEMSQSVTIKTNSNGEFWVFIGGEATEEGKTEFYILDIEVITETL